MRSVIDYAAPVFHPLLPAYLWQELERVQKRAMRIISNGIEYQQALALMSLPTVAEYHHNICPRTFESIMSDPNHKLRKLLPPLYKSNSTIIEGTRALSLCLLARQMDLRTVFHGFMQNCKQFLGFLAITIITFYYNS